jgi:hypothetical protein
MSDRLDKLVDEARRELGAREVEQVDWDAVDRKLFARIRAEQRVEPATLHTGRGAGWAFGAAALAAAAAVALVVGKTRESGSDVSRAEATAAPASSVASMPTGAVLLVDGKPASAGAVVHLGDVLEARGAAVTFSRPGKLTWVLEPGSVADVTHVDGALVLGLERGAVEAQVVPVSSGEAFAVDVEGARVAVHGTHLRVERTGDHVVVDLNEGVVVVGPAPRVGSTIGALVTAPAHADFGAAGCAAGNPAIAVSHDVSAVRAPIALGASGGAAVMLPSPAIAVVSPPNARPGDARPALPSPQRPLLAAPQPPAPPSEPSAPPPAPQPDPAAPSVVAAAVRSCMAARTSAENVTVVVSTTVHVELDADGNVKAARFDPPVAPDVNACAASVIYRTRFTHDGSADIPVDFKVPSSAP